MKTFDEKTRQYESDAHTGYCRIEKCVNRIHSFHHRLPNTIANRKNFPLFLQSIFNIAGLCFEHHTYHSSVGVDITEREAMAYEAFLREFGRWAIELSNKRKEAIPEIFQEG